MAIFKTSCGHGTCDRVQQSTHALVFTKCPPSSASGNTVLETLKQELCLFRGDQSTSL